MPNRADGPPRHAAVHFEPVRFDPAGFSPLRIAGAWRVHVGDPRFGGVSAMAVDGGKLLALTDSGTLIWLPKPGAGRVASLRDLPAGPGTTDFKRDRDSEALARDPKGRGWWIAFEQWNQVWLYDRAFRRAISRIDLGRNRWSHNKGIEAMTAGPRGFILFSERGNEWLAIAGRQVTSREIRDNLGYVADAVSLADGRSLLVTRQVSVAGLEKRMVLVEWRGGVPRFQPFAPLGLGATDNVEALATEPLPQGGTRLWLMTDNDFRPRAASLLVALDMP